MTISPLAHVDYTQWHTLWQSYLQVYQINLPDTTPQHTWQNLLNPSQPVHGLGAFSADTQMVALRTSLSAPIPRRNMAMTNCCYLEELFVAPSARKQGIARRLLQAIRAKAELPPLQPHLLGDTNRQPSSATALPAICQATRHAVVPS